MSPKDDGGSVEPWSHDDVSAVDAVTVAATGLIASVASGYST